ncbi:tetratricopeptide repeat protein [uncultured Croceitalea sp.]|uniref:tetratricopeptide repeat protein n=1 Tax=uncultured Croceitalea sp. TaxID=1798908 RepID=UPI003305BA56
MSKRSPEFFDLIEAYLDNKLNPNDKDDFERKMVVDAKFREEVEKHRLLHEVFTDTDSLEFRKKLIKIESGVQETLSKKEKYSFFNWKIAATVLIMVSLTSLFIFQNFEKDQTLFEKYFTLYPVEDVVRSSQESNVKKAMEEYSSGNYSSAVLEFEKLVTEMPNSYELKVYLGNSYLKNGDSDKALGEFRSLVNTSNYAEIAKWYMALSYLKTNENDKSISLLKEIIAYDGIYKEDAKNLHKDLLKMSNP